MKNFISWTNGFTWLYGTEIEAQWLGDGQQELKVTVYFGSYETPKVGGSKKIFDLSIHSDVKEEINLVYGGVQFTGQFTWANKQTPSETPQIKFDGAVVVPGFSNVGLSVLIPVVVQPS